jgi:hypothetical protein
LLQSKRASDHGLERARERELSIGRGLSGSYRLAFQASKLLTSVGNAWYLERVRQG